jgi:hypothetical protein
MQEADKKKKEEKTRTRQLAHKGFWWNGFRFSPHSAQMAAMAVAVDAVVVLLLFREAELLELFRCCANTALQLAATRQKPRGQS